MGFSATAERPLNTIQTSGYGMDIEDKSIRISKDGFNPKMYEALLKGGDALSFEIMNHFQYVFSKLKDC